jgi:hypothetical protein
MPVMDLSFAFRTIAKKFSPTSAPGELNLIGVKACDPPAKARRRSCWAPVARREPYQPGSDQANHNLDVVTRAKRKTFARTEFFIEKDTRRFPDTNGWACANLFLIPLPTR